MKMRCRLLLLVILCCGFALPAQAAGSPTEQWDALLEITGKFSWYPQPDVQKLLEGKGTEYGQSLEEYRSGLLTEITGGRTPAVRIRASDFLTGLPWRKYYHLSLAEFSLFLANGKEIHLQNAQEALSVLAEKTEQPEVAFWNDIYRCQRACLTKDRNAFIAAAFHLWQKVILRFELETLLFPNGTAQVGFVRNLPYLYENLAHLVIRKAIVEREIADLYPLSALILDIQPKLTVENGYKEIVGQVVARMQGAGSDNRNLNFAVALLEATDKRYDFEDEKDAAELAAKYHLTRKYYLLAASWADTGKGKAALLAEQMGFLNYVISRFGSNENAPAAKAFFANLPLLASEQLEQAIASYDRLAAPAVEQSDGRTEGFEDRKVYLQSMHQLWDATAKLAFVLSDYYRNNRPQNDADIFPAARPLEQYCDLFARHARSNPQIVPDNAYFLTAYAARELADLYRRHALYSTDNRANNLAFAYQLQAAELFPLDLPGVLQLAFQSTLDGRVPDFFQYSTPLATRLRASGNAASWSSRHPGEFAGLIGLLPTVVPEVFENAFFLLQHMPEKETSEDILFATTVTMAKTLMAGTATGRKAEKPPAARGETASKSPEADLTSPYFELKSHLYGATESPLHEFLRTLFNEIPYENHQYVALLKKAR